MSAPRDPEQPADEPPRDPAQATDEVCDAHLSPPGVAAALDPLAGRALAAFRFDTRRALLRSVALSLPLMSVGVALLGVGLRHLQLREPARQFAGRATFQLAEGASGHVLPWEQALMVGGVLLVVLSNLVLVRALRRNLAIERFILLRADGLVRQVDTHFTLVPWDDVEQVCYAPERRAIVLQMRAGGVLSGRRLRGHHPRGAREAHA